MCAPGTKEWEKAFGKTANQSSTPASTAQKTAPRRVIETTVTTVTTETVEVTDRTAELAAV